MRQNLMLERQDDQPHGSGSRARSYPDHDLLASASLLAGCRGHINLSCILKFTYTLPPYLLAGLLSIFCSLDLPVCVLSKGLADAASDVRKVRLHSRDCFLSCWPPKTSELSQCRWKQTYTENGGKATSHHGALTDTPATHVNQLTTVNGLHFSCHAVLGGNQTRLQPGKWVWKNLSLVGRVGSWAPGPRY